MNKDVQVSNFRDDSFLPKNRKTNITSKSNGMGYFIPPSTSKEEWKRIKSLWDKKLRASGFTDIECPARDNSGFFSPYLLQNSIDKNKNSKISEVLSSNEGYFSYCSSFYNLFNFRSLTNKKWCGRRYGLLRELMRLHAAGVSYIDMTKALAGHQTPYMTRFNIKVVQRRYRQKRSKYWCFTQMVKVLEVMWLWHATDEEGCLTPYDLRYMEASGITERSYDTALSMLLEKPCKRLAQEVGVEVREATEAPEAS